MYSNLQIMIFGGICSFRWYFSIFPLSDWDFQMNCSDLNNLIWFSLKNDAETHKSKNLCETR